MKPVSLVFLWLAISAPRLGATDLIKVESLFYRLGDHPAWAASPMSDPAWKPMQGFDPALAGAVFWVVGEVDLPERSGLQRPLSLEIIATASYELWWDGRLIGRSGQVGQDRVSEKPGPLDNAFLVPDDLAGLGRHRLAMRLSSFHKSKKAAGYLFHIDLKPMALPTRAMDFHSTQRLPFLGIIFLVGLFYLLVFAVDDRRTDTLLFALLCLSVAAMIVAESWRDLFGYAYHKHALRLQSVLALTAMTCFLLVVFLASRFFPGEKLRWLLLALVGLAAGFAASRTFDGRAMAMMFGTLVLALLLLARAVLYGKPGSRLALAGISLVFGLMVWKRYGFMDRYFFMAFGLLLLGLTIAQALELRARSRARREAMLTAARLEIELLKKNIQPHFLLNTLTSLIEWLEEAPATGVRLLHALADELRLLGQISNRQEISMEQELALCRSHLAVMGYRRDCRFSLETKGVDPAQTVPPALFHTLVENGVSHHGGAADHRLRLEMESLPTGRRFTFTAPTLEASPALAEGTGLRYIKARLRERYPGRWTFRHGPIPGAWQTIIEIKAA